METQLYIYNNTGYQCHKFLGFVKLDEVTRDYIVTDSRNEPKGRVVTNVSLVREHIQNLMKGKVGGHNETVEELVSELKLIFTNHKRLFIMIEEMRKEDLNGN